jgi:hypothetical protein
MSKVDQYITHNDPPFVQLLKSTMMKCGPSMVTDVFVFHVMVLRIGLDEVLRSIVISLR